MCIYCYLENSKIGDIPIFLDVISYVAGPYHVLALNIKNLIMITLVILETRLKVPILAVFVDFKSLFYDIKF